MPGPSDSSSRAKGRPSGSRPKASGGPSQSSGSGPKRSGAPAGRSGGSGRSSGPGDSSSRSTASSSRSTGPGGSSSRSSGPPKRSGPPSGGPRGSSGPKRSGPPSRSRPGAKPGSKGGAPRRSSARDHDVEGQGEVYRKGWGSLARKGAARIAPLEGVGDSATAEWRKAVQEARDKDLGKNFAPEEWVRVDDVRDEASGAVERGRQKKGSGRSDRTIPSAPAAIADQREELGKSVGARQAEKLAKVVRDAARAFERERYGDSRKLLAPIAERVPTFAPARELLGVTYYRMGRWKQAVRELEAFRDLTDSTEQHPVLADCYRALGKWKQVDELWVELREASPSAELVTEGRIVAAGALADQGKIRPAIALLGAHGWKLPKAAHEHHLRRAYALADLYERAGDVAHARDLFGRILKVDPDFGDVAERARALN